MSQLDFARELGVEGMEQVLSNAEKLGFDSAGAMRFMLMHLKAVGRMVCEDWTDAAKKAGYVPHDDRAFGGVIARLKRHGHIREVGQVLRRKGRSAPGARIWEPSR